MPEASSSHSRIRHDGRQSDPAAHALSSKLTSVMENRSEGGLKASGTIWAVRVRLLRPCGRSGGLGEKGTKGSGFILGRLSRIDSTFFRPQNPLAWEVLGKTEPTVSGFRSLGAAMPELGWNMALYVRGRKFPGPPRNFPLQFAHLKDFGSRAILST